VSATLLPRKLRGGKTAAAIATPGVEIVPTGGLPLPPGLGDGVRRHAMTAMQPARNSTDARFTTPWCPRLLYTRRPSTAFRGTMSFVDDFKKFAFKGNVVDLAVGVVIGGAFGKIVSALVADLVMPIVALILPSGDWRSHGLVLSKAADAKDDVVLKYGDFLGAILDFFVVALALFVIVSRIIKAAEARLVRPPPTEPLVTRECPLCCETVPLRAKRCKFCTGELPAT
jgi:large conductance mechanosensitive channel